MFPISTSQQIFRRFRRPRLAHRDPDEKSDSSGCWSSDWRQQQEEENAPPTFDFEYINFQLLFLSVSPRRNPIEFFVYRFVVINRREGEEGGEKSDTSDTWGVKKQGFVIRLSRNNCRCFTLAGRYHIEEKSFSLSFFIVDSKSNIENGKGASNRIAAQNRCTLCLDAVEIDSRPGCIHYIRTCCLSINWKSASHYRMFALLNDWSLWSGCSRYCSWWIDQVFVQLISRHLSSRFKNYLPYCFGHC